MLKIEKLKELGFFDLNNNEQIQFLKKYGFFNLSNQDRIKFLEITGLFYIDINDDPPNIPLTAENVDYLKKNPMNVKKNVIANSWKESFTNNALKSRNLVINEINGIENALCVETGAIVTLNHFNPFDTFAIERVFKDAGIKKRMHKVIREGNYTNFPGKFGLYFRHDNTLPLSQLPETMEIFEEALETILKKGDFIIVCPEQSMWLNYKQPKPFKYGAFKWATLNNVPVIPTFITMMDKGSIEGDEAVAQEYNINIGEPIYPDNTLLPRENICRMRDLDYSFCKETYERYYGVPVKYRTINHENIPNYVSSTPGFYDLIPKDDVLEDEDIDR